MDISKLTVAAITYDKGDAKRIQHFIKVHSFAELSTDLVVAHAKTPAAYKAFFAIVQDFTQVFFVTVAKVVT